MTYLNLKISTNSSNQQKTKTNRLDNQKKQYNNSLSYQKLVCGLIIHLYIL